MEFVRFVGGLLTAWLAGRGLLAACGLEQYGGTLGRQARAVTVGLGALVIIWLPLLRLGFWFNWVTIAASGILLGALSVPAWRARKVATASWPADATAESHAWRVAAGVLCAATVALFFAKTVAAPLWSWDHFAIWGVKARWLSVAPVGDWDFLNSPSFARSRPDHPLGLPMAWLILGLAGTPTALTFKAAHLVWATSVLALFLDAMRRRGWSLATTLMTVAFLSLGPLFWDTGNVGLAEMLLAVVALCASDLLFDKSLTNQGLLLGGVLLAILPWIKQEGISLALLLAAAGLVFARHRDSNRWRSRVLVVGIPLLVGIAACRWLQSGLASGSAEGYLSADWLLRGSARAHQFLSIAETFVAELLVWDWLGFWPLVLMAVGLAVWSHRLRGLELLAAVAVQLGLYLAICYLTYADPHDQIRAAVFRLAAPLQPLALLAMTLLPLPHADSRD